MAHKTLLTELQDDIRKHPARQARYERELTRLRLANEIVKLREEGKLSQAQLAKRIGTHQSAIARMEQSTYRGYTVATLAKIAAASGKHLVVRFVSRGRRAQHA
ncbi:MAG TPA: helix-turn-helix transcriptional regulator [Methylomirabilota bacterium]|nr:helix-turn-helix transcriptional regulator [Methylomirabilota bacterium]